MGGIDIIDESGKPRSDADIEEVRAYLTKTMVTSRMDADPELIVLIPTMLDMIAEIGAIRKLIRKSAPDYGK